MLTIARKSMYPQLKELWMLGFGDDRAYTDFLFDNILHPEQILVWIEEKRYPAAMVCLQPMELRDGAKVRNGAYLYGFTVHPRYRKKGLGTKLMAGFDDYVQTLDCAATVLVPASTELFAYYGKRGFETAFAKKEVTWFGETLLPPLGGSSVLVPRELDSLWRMRNDFYRNSGLYVGWPIDYLYRVGEETRYRNGGTLLYTSAEGDGYLTFRQEAAEVFVTEFAIAPELLEDALYTLHRRLGAERYTLRLPADYSTAKEASVLPFAMIKWYDRQKGVSGRKSGPTSPGEPYIAHVMD